MVELIRRFFIVLNRFMFGNLLKFEKQEIRAVEKHIRSKYIYNYREL